MIKIMTNLAFNGNHLVPGLESIIRYLKSESVNFEFGEFDELSDLAETTTQSLVRCDFLYAKNHFSTIKMAPENVRFTGLFDSLEINSGRPFPRLYYTDCLRKTIINRFKKLNLSSAAALFCESDERAGLTSVLVSLGFKTILFFQDHIESSDILALEKYFIGIEFRFISLGDLTQNQIFTSLIINSLDLESKPSIINDLAYFNFLERAGILIDLFSKTPIHPLLFEAEKAGLQTMSRKDFALEYNYESLSRLIKDNGLYKKDFKNLVSEIETID